jgi:hypothetical protein
MAETTDVSKETSIDAGPAAVIQISPAAADNSLAFIGQWNRLISTTNWGKGEIICQWRKSLENTGASIAEFSDEAWSQMVGGVTPQHVGRLRRTFERFGHVYGEYDGVYWSHFYASLDWEDAEMWLEGAVQSKWSVSKMRQHRWETLGKVSDQQPHDSDIVSSELNEETQSLELSENKRQNDQDYIAGPVHEGPDFGDEGGSVPSGKSSSDFSDDTSSPQNSAANIRPFESFTNLPDDIDEVTNAFKVAIIRHKAAEWEEISKEDMVGVLDALKQLALIPSQ